MNDKRLTFISLLIAAIACGFAIWSHFDNKNLENITIQGMLVDENDKSFQVKKISLSKQLGKFFEDEMTDGVFEIPNVDVPKSNQIELVFMLYDSTMINKNVDIPTPRTIVDGVLGLGVIKLEGLSSKKDDVVIQPIVNLDPVKDTMTPDEEIIEMKCRVNTENSPLIVRRRPNKKSENIGDVAKGSYVSIMEVIGETTYLDGRRGNWCKIKHGDDIGYVFGGFLYPNPSFPQE